ncbi:AAA family ATPase [Rhizoctonia solani]|uniref:AAA family ATPase n=1 Tax=Rhizoctonia solani TaxID=456999 RepID=A0A8H8NYH3_9AGAM|nr:AAA family ATPase [Rhizoctonia solani]QRW20661.1 AAA family ATPase [Rhizoctonia solani]
MDLWGPTTGIDDHTWIELVSTDLVTFLRSQWVLKGITGLNESSPGIDAREIFLRLETLKALATKPVLESEDEELFDEELKPEESRASIVHTAPPTASVPVALTNGSSEDLVQLPLNSDPPPVDTKPPLTVPEQLWLLLDFVESHFTETVKEFKRLESDGYISFKLLWTLCAPGKILETKDEESDFPKGMRVESWSYGNNGTVFTMKGATYSWDGKVFKQDITPVGIWYFKGLMKMDQVPIKVMTDQRKSELIERGRIYQKYAGIHYLKYNAFIVVPTGCRTIKIPGKGRVMVDASGYSRYNLNTSGGYQAEIWNPHVDSYPAYSPLDSPRRRHANRKTDVREEYSNDTRLPDDIICLTPPTHKAWSFAAKTWGKVLVTNLSEIIFDELAFDQLVLRPEYKKIIKAMVETHSESGNDLARDLVSGKGGGLVMVLHGKPGTGKTLTAEAVSEHLKCPLYVVSSGELGTQAPELEKQLNNILEMTTTWKAVVLIDEADVFLEARNTFDITRNSLVSVFLRVLEYHTGVLILTTNRIRTFDNAFISRISMAIHYPDLDQASRSLIWKEASPPPHIATHTMGLNTPPSSDKSAYITHEELASLAKKSFNGRVIKQIIRGAQALSIADKEPLRLSHVLTLLGITEQFETDLKTLEATENVSGADGAGKELSYTPR